MTQPDHEGVRFFVRADDPAVPGIRSYPGWTVVQVLPDPAHPGRSLVEVEDQDAPAEAAGLICEPTFTRHRDPHSPEAPGVIRITSYGIPADRGEPTP